MGNLAAGDYVHDSNGAIRIMAIVEGYAVARRPGRAPFLFRAKDMEHNGRKLSYSPVMLSSRP